MMDTTVRCVLTLLILSQASGQGTNQQVNRMKNVLSALSRQVMLQQLASEEKARADGGSGLKQIRVNKEGPENFYVHSHTGDSVAAIHDHSNQKNMLGMGEGQYVLNGVEFRTRHNDYLLRMPSTKSPTYNLVEEIPFPPVPPEVLRKGTVRAQIAEMRQWFKAWQKQDHSRRDYRPYFRPVLCYLEGAWTTKTETVEEPFFSDRHALDADTWFDLQEKVRFTAYTGRKSLEENYAYLPTTIINITESGLPVYAQWNYRILCHPLSKNVPLSHLKVVDDLGSRLARKKSLWRHRKSRAARFRVVGASDKKLTTRTFMETLMGEIPGKDNYMANITDDSFGVVFLDPRSKNRSALNVGYYHKRYRVAKPDAMGQVFSSRGFSDLSVYMAETTQPRVAPMYIRQCKKGKCYQTKKRMTYAIPLEIVYLTPLSRWNPFRLYNHPVKNKKANTANGKRNGGFTKAKAYNGTHRSMYQRTPAAFFSGGEVESDPADTVRGVVGVLDQEGQVRKTVASGVRIFLPNIPGVGILRTRYPVMPVYGENSGVWKELNALKDIVMKLASNERYLLEKIPRSPAPTTSPVTCTDDSNKTKKPTSQISQTDCKNVIVQPEASEDNDSAGSLTLMTTTIYRDPPGEHSHTVELSQEDLESLKKGQTVDAVTSEDNGHSHTVTIRYSNQRYLMVSCDDGSVPCWDGHTSCLMTETGEGCPSGASSTSAGKDKNVDISKGNKNKPTKPPSIRLSTTTSNTIDLILPRGKNANVDKTKDKSSSSIRLSSRTTSNTNEFVLPTGKGTNVNFGSAFDPGLTNSRITDTRRALFSRLFGGHYFL